MCETLGSTQRHTREVVPVACVGGLDLNNNDVISDFNVRIKMAEPCPLEAANRVVHFSLTQ